MPSSWPTPGRPPRPDPAPAPAAWNGAAPVKRRRQRADHSAGRLMDQNGSGHTLSGDPPIAPGPVAGAPINLTPEEFPAMKSLATWCVRHRVDRAAAVAGRTHRHDRSSPRRSAPPTPTASRCPTPSRPRPSSCCRRPSRSIAGDREQIVFHTTDGTKVTDPTVMATVNTMLAKVKQVPHVTAHHQSLRPARGRPDQQGRADGLRHGHLRSTGPEHLDPGGQAVRVDRPERRGPEPPGGRGRAGRRSGRQAVLRGHRARA